MIRRRHTRAHVVRRGTVDIDPSAELLEGPIQTHVVVQPNGTLRIGSRTSVGHGCGLACTSHIEIGDDVTIGPFVQILDNAFHQTTSHRERPEARKVIIGSGAVIGAWSMILPGAVVEPHEVVAPGSTITARR